MTNTTGRAGRPGGRFGGPLPISGSRRATGQERRYTIGSFPDWSVAAAREKAKELKRSVDSGGDPLGEVRASRDAPTVADLCARFEAEHVIGCESRQPVILIAGFIYGLAKRGILERGIIGRPAAKEPDHRHRRLLCARRERPSGRRAAEQRDELAPF
jgi:Arm DNA-binding domain